MQEEMGVLFIKMVASTTSLLNSHKGPQPLGLLKFLARMVKTGYIDTARAQAFS